MKTLTDIGLNSFTVKSLFAIWGLIILVFALLCVAFYFIESTALYKMAKTKGVKKKKYAFLPFYRCITIDSLASKCANRAGSARKLIVSRILSVVFCLVSFVITAFSLIDIVFLADKLMYNGKTVNITDVKSIIIKTAIGLAVALAVYVVYFVLLIMDLAKIYSFFSKNKVLLIVLSVIFPCFIPIFLYFIIENYNKTEKSSDNI